MGSDAIAEISLTAQGAAYSLRYQRRYRFQPFVLVFDTFSRPYLCEFEAYGDSESTFTCLTFHAKSIDVLGFVERYREVAQIDISGLKNLSFVEIRVLSHDSLG